MSAERERSVGEAEPRYFEDVRVGDRLGPLVKVLTTEMVRQFCATWGSRTPSRFTDDEAARKDGLPHAIVPGIMSMALAGNLLTTWAPGGQVLRLESLFRKPVPHNQPVRVEGVVTAVGIHEGKPRVECDVHLRRDEDETFVTSSAILTLPLRAG